MRQRGVGLLLLSCVWLLVDISPDTCYAYCQKRQNLSNRKTRNQRVFVIDERLAVIRKESNIKSTVVRRLSIGRPVIVLSYRPAIGGEAGFYRVAVTRRTSGWIHEGALAFANRKGDDLRLASLIENDYEGFDRLKLCRLFEDHFSNSTLLPKIMLILGGEAEKSAAELTQRKRSLINRSGVGGSRIPLRDYLLSDSGLDRYNRLNIKFDFDANAMRYRYDGQIYRELVKQFPHSEEGQEAQKRLQKK